MASFVDSEFLRCKLCEDNIKDPRTLPCLHNFCGRCLDDYIKKLKGVRDSEEFCSFPCPTCEREVGLQTQTNPEVELAETFCRNSFLANLVRAKEILNGDCTCESCQQREVSSHAAYWCRNCKEAMCYSCGEIHLSFRNSRDHDLATLTSLASEDRLSSFVFSSHNCLKHGKKIKTFCCDCEVMTCTSCFVEDHRSCLNVVRLEEAVQTKKAVAENFLGTMMSEASDLEKMGKAAIEHLEKLEVDEVNSIQKFRETTAQMTKALLKNEEKLINNIKTLCRMEKDTLLDALKEYRSQQCLLIRSSELLKNALKYASGSDFLVVLTDVEKALAERSTPPEFVKRELLVEPCENSDLHLMQVLNYTVDFTPPTHTHSPDANSKAYQFERPTMPTRTVSGRICKALYDTSCFISNIVTLEACLMISDSTNSKLKLYSHSGDFISEQVLDFSPKGLCRLLHPDAHVCVTMLNAKTITLFTIEDSEFLLHSEATTTACYTAITAVLPERLACAQDKSTEITIINLDGVLLSSFNVTSGADLIRHDFTCFNTRSFQLATTLSKDIIVLDSSTNVLRSFDISGNVKFTYTDGEAKTSYDSYRSSVCVDTRGFIYVSDRISHRVYRLTPDGKMDRTVLSTVCGIAYPKCLCVLPGGILVLTDWFATDLKFFLFSALI